MAIKNLPNYVWVYPGKKDPFSGELATTRYARNLLNGDKLSLRQAQKKQRGGVSYEKSKPKAQRKQYKKRSDYTKQYTKKGPFTDIPDVITALKTMGDAIVSVTARGILREGQSPDKDENGKEKKKKLKYRTITPLAEASTLANVFTRILARTERPTPYQLHIERNLEKFEMIKSYTINIKKEIKG